MTPGVRAALDAVEDVLLGLDTDATDLWDILSALRGPDDRRAYGDPRGSKKSATVPIRRAAFPRLAEKDDVVGKIADFYPSTFNVPDSFDHFTRHARDAWDALNR